MEATVKDLLAIIGEKEVLLSQLRRELMEAQQQLAESQEPKKKGG